ncbi:MAG: hypothetical protein U0R44_05935 [Candidatus Micrarchaeia archaeon]
MQEKKKPGEGEAAPRRRPRRSALSEFGLSIDSPFIADSKTDKLGFRDVEDAGSVPKDQKISEIIYAPEKELLMKLLGRQGEFEQGALKEFMELDAGVRELRWRNFLASIWTEGDWKAKARSQTAGNAYVNRSTLVEAEKNYWAGAYGQLSKACGLKDATGREKLTAILTEPLTERQRAFVGLTPQETGDGHKRSEVMNFKEWVAGLDPREAANLWKVARPDAVTLADLAWKLRYSKGTGFSDDQSYLMRWLLKANPASEEQIEEFNEDLCSSFKKNRVLLVEASEHIWRSPDGLLESARSSEEYLVMLEFLGIPFRSASAEIQHKRGFSEGSWNLDGRHQQNDDSFTSLDIRSDGRTIRIDAVFDGVSGHSGGYMASGIARETLEIAAMSGWITTPEEGRKALILCDIVICLEKTRCKIYDMGTTAAISFIDGADFHGIHCGDSDWKIMRGGQIIETSKAHGFGNTIYAGLGLGASPIHINNRDRGYSPIKLQKRDRIITLTDGITDPVCDHEICMALRGIEDSGTGTRRVVDIALDRKDGEASYKPRCGCEPRDGKDDDVTMILAFISK